MRRRSRGGARIDRAYKLARSPFLEANRFCEIGAPGCAGRSEEVHHVVKRSASQALVSDRRNFCASCWSCNQYVEAEPDWAKLNGFTIPAMAGITIPEYQPSPVISARGYVLVEVADHDPLVAFHRETTFAEHWLLCMVARWVPFEDQDVVIYHRNGRLDDNRWANLRVEGLHPGW